MSAVEVLDLACAEFRAMGTDVQVLVLDGVDDDLRWARAEADRLEALWSRFRDDSEVAHVTAGAGSWVPVTAETLALVRAAAEAQRSTGGAFDPLLGGALCDLGYDRSFETMDLARAGAQTELRGLPRRTPSAALELDEARRAIRIPRRSALDLGGIAKGWTADRLVAGLVERGARGACANLGGDLAVAGRAPYAAGWPIEVTHDAALSERGVLMVAAGGVATSTTLRRAWAGPGGDARHHLLDPGTGAPCTGGPVEITVVAHTAATAEVLAKVGLVSPARLRAALDAAGAAALVTSADGVTVALGDEARLSAPAA